MFAPFETWGSDCSMPKVGVGTLSAPICKATMTDKSNLSAISRRRLADEERWAPTQSRRLGEWLGEFEQLDEEFGEIKVEWDRRCLSIVTEPITLQEVDLGPFAIELFWERLARRVGSSCFEIVALEPNPATCNESVTHPHVREGELCAGDATTPIEKALDRRPIGRCHVARALGLTVLQPAQSVRQFGPLVGHGLSRLWNDRRPGTAQLLRRL